MGKLIVVLLLFSMDIILLISLLVNGCRWGIRRLKKQDCIHMIQVLKKNSMVLIAGLLLMILFIWVTQLTVSTPDIRDENGHIVDGSIAELKQVTVNGHKEWVSIRGKDKSAPVLLFLAGGPGGTQMATTRHELTKLEDTFVVVNWDQPGSGKSYDCMKQNDITIQTYIDDGISLTEYLREQFGQNKIYLVGESWGSALGILLVNEAPEYYAGCIGTGQMVDFEETEVMDYDKAIEIAKNQDDQKTVNKLVQQGAPLYYKGNIAMKSAAYLNYLSSYMTKDPNISNGGYHTFRDILSSEYGILDSVNYMLGLMSTFNAVYPQLYDVDLRKACSKLKVPVYFFIGRHDINAPTSLVEDYYNLLEAPRKELIWFEHSGHSPWLNETNLFIEETNRVFLK